MNKHIIIASTIASLLLTSVALAETNSKTKIETRADLDAKIELLKEKAKEARNLAKENPSQVEDKLKEMKDSVKELTDRPRKEVFMNAGEKLLNRLMAASERQFSLLTRLGTRIETMASEGTKVDALKLKLTEAQKAADAAKSSVFDLATKLSGMIEKIDSSKKEVLVSVREAAASTIKLLKTAQQKIVEVISMAKKASLGAETKVKVEDNQ